MEKFSGNVFNMRKSMILDDFEMLKQMNNAHLENKLKSKNEEIREQADEEDLEGSRVIERQLKRKISVKKFT